MIISSFVAVFVSVQASGEFRFSDSEVVLQVTSGTGQKLVGLIEPATENSYIVEGKGVNLDPLAINVKIDSEEPIGAIILTDRIPASESTKKYDFVLGYDFCQNFSWILVPGVGFVQPVVKRGLADAAIQYSKKMRRPATFPLTDDFFGKTQRFSFSLRVPPDAKLRVAPVKANWQFPLIADSKGISYFSLGSFCSQRFIVDFPSQEITFETAPDAIVENLLSRYPQLEKNKSEVTAYIQLGKYGSIDLDRAE